MGHKCRHVHRGRPFDVCAGWRSSRSDSVDDLHVLLVEIEDDLRLLWYRLFGGHLEWRGLGL